MNNINELRKELAQTYKALKNGTANAKDVKELNNCAGKIINTLKVELEFAALRKVTPNIPFLDYAKE